MRLENNDIVEVKEKERISNNCSVGTYVFFDSQEFISVSEKYMLEIDLDSSKEYYIAPLYDFAIKNSHKVIPLKIESVEVFGTPEELLDSFKISLSELRSENDFRGHQRKCIVVDIDGTICSKPPAGDYSKCQPIKKFVDKLNYEEAKGTYIILYTSRNMRSFSGNIGLINKYTSQILLSWLYKNKIPFDEIYFW